MKFHSSSNFVNTASLEKSLNLVEFRNEITLTTHSHTKHSHYIALYFSFYFLSLSWFGGMMVFLQVDPPDRAFFKEVWCLTLDWQVASSGGIDSHHNAQHEQLRHHGGFTSGTCFHSDCDHRVEVTFSLWMLVLPLSSVHSVDVSLPSWSETSFYKKRHIYINCYYVNIVWISYCVKRSNFTPESKVNKYRPIFYINYFLIF